MPLFLRAPLRSDYLTLSTWVPDANSSARWAGAALAFPLSAAELPVKLSLPESHSYVLTDETGAMLGFGQHWPRPTGAVHLGRIIVDPQQHGRGLGVQLCHLLIAAAVKTSGRKTITLRVYRDNPAAMAVYSKLGFLPVEAESDASVLMMVLKVPAQL